jgi:hypothetical protein
MLEAMLLSLISFGSIVLASAQADLGTPAPRIQPPNLLRLSRGKDSASQIDVSIDPKFHMQANPASRKNLIPTELTFDPPSGITVQSVSYPTGSLFRFGAPQAPQAPQTSGSSGDLSVYQGDFGIRFALHATQHAHLGKQLVRAKLRYQCCDEKACFRPSEVSFDFWVDIQ